MTHEPGDAEAAASNLYVAVVLGSGPSAEARDHIGADQLGIPDNKMSDFIVKRFYLHEAFLLVAFSVAEAEAYGKHGSSPVRPLTVEIGKKLQGEWASREDESPSLQEVGERCFKMVEHFTKDPETWSRNWLLEFSGDEAQLSDQVDPWAEQCLRELLALKRLAVYRVAN